MATMNWTAIGPDAGAATFTAQIAIGDGEYRDIVADETIEILAPAPVSIRLTNFSGFANNDPRFMDATIDFGDEYTFASHSDPDVPTSGSPAASGVAPRLLGGSTAGTYDGILAGHSMRGAVAGTQVLTGTYTGGPGPTGTIDQTIAIDVSDGTTSAPTLNCKVRLIHRDVFYLDADRTLGTLTPEARRWGIIYVSRDGDFTGALPEQAPNTTTGGVAHMIFADGRFASSNFEKTDITNGNQSGHNWGSSGYPECIALLFKAGETFYPGATFNPISFGQNCTFGTWTHAGSSAKAIWRGDFSNQWGSVPGSGMIFSNRPNYSGGTNPYYGGWRFTDLHLLVSDHDPSEETTRDWTNKLKYSGKTGTFGPNTNTNQVSSGWNGEFITNAAGLIAQVISDDGVDTLTVRHVADISATDAGTTQAKYDSRKAVAAAFTDGDTLTGASGATCTFVATGSRQDRTRKTPDPGFEVIQVEGVLIDNCEVSGASEGIKVGPGSVISDTVVRYPWNYAVTVTGGPDPAYPTDFMESGVVVVQPKDYEGAPRAFAGELQHPNRNAYNTTDGVTATTPELNGVSHSARRFGYMRRYSQHFCITRWFGGHGSEHQPGHRFGTDGQTAEGELEFQMSNSAIMGGRRPIQFTQLDQTDKIPYTPAYIRVQNTHLMSDYCSDGEMITTEYTNFRYWNCLFESPAIAGDLGSATKFVGDLTAPTHDSDPDVNAVAGEVNFCTMVGRFTNAGSTTLNPNSTDVRGTTINYSNNAFAVNIGGYSSVDSTISDQNDAPGDYTVGYYPNVNTVNAYQTATGTVPAEDAEGTTRGVNPSKGAFEPV